MGATVPTYSRPPTSLDQFGEPLDDPRRLGRGVRRHASVKGVVPDAAHAEALRRHDFPLVIVADHPGVAGLDVEPLQRVAIDRELGLALAELAFDLDMVEAMAEIEAHDLVALRLGRAGGD